ncbi:MAG: D-TA family PLP-dependent enzyme [Verrucomicrobia bacterium]|nr:D-TA family PLP-dependent enzyme [Verrucomicrobiota bacterium]MDA1068770.1 D-TA family PLP-dependent enzyme [Verrucomicrobiota bacterium]
MILKTYPENFPDVSDVSSPALLVYPDRVRSNIQRMIEIADDPARLRPHIKTHKSAEIVRMQMEVGIQKFKCATLAEAELLAQEKAADILLAIQPIGPDIRRYAEMAKAFPHSRFSVVVDNAGVIHQLNTACEAHSITIGAYLDLNVGMNRTGIQPGMEAIARYRLLHEMPRLDVLGLHVYDGHIHDRDIDVRTERVEDAYDSAEDLVRQLVTMGYAPPVVIAGGSPSFPIHARRQGVELSPGTTLLWDAKSISTLDDMPFEPAAFLLTRVVSKPAKGLVCFDLGHKAVAAEMPHPRVDIQGLEDCEFVSQSEEHLVAKVDNWSDIQVGDAFLGIPKHICPTVALYDHVNVIENDRVTGQWKNAARHRL